MVYKIPPGGEVNHIQPVAYYVLNVSTQANLVLCFHLLRAKCQYSSLSRNMASLATCKMSILKLVSYYAFICYVQNVNTQACLVLRFHLLRAKCQYSSLSRNMASLATCKMSILKLVSYYAFICYVQNVNTQASLVLCFHLLRAKCQYLSLSRILLSFATCKMSILMLVSYYAFICYVQNVNTQACLVIWLHLLRAKCQYSS